MARTNPLNTSTSTFLELIGNGRLHSVPPYQRDYSWTEEQWEDLWTEVEVFDALRVLYVADERFQQDFARLAPDPAGQGRRMVRHVLARLEADASARACDPGTDPGTVEHVLPSNPSTAWERGFPRDLWNRSIHRLGNLTWLEPSLNRQIGNADFAVKRAAYLGSRDALSRRLPDEVGDDRTPDHLDARQRRMAERAVHLWRADFA